MRFLFMLFVFVLLGISCQEEIVYLPEEPQVEESDPVLHTPSPYKFVYYSSFYFPKQGYLISELISPAKDLYLHHLVLTQKDLLNGNELRGESHAVAFNFVTKGKAITGVHTSAYDDNSPRIISYGAQKSFNFSRDANLADVYPSNGALTISRTDDAFSVEAKFSKDDNFTILKGTFKGDITEISPPTSIPVDERLFQGSNEFTFLGQTHTLNHAYMARGILGEQGPGYKFYLTTNDILGNANQFYGTSDLIILRLYASSPDLAGVFLPDVGTLSTYGERVNPRLTGIGNFCRNMNFLTRRADDEVYVESVTVNVVTSENNIKLHFIGLDASGQQVTGIYQGPLTVFD